MTLIIVLTVYLVNLNKKCKIKCINKQMYLDKDKCKCISCNTPSCGIGMWYDNNSRCVNSNKNPKEYECLTCPTCPADKKPDINKPCGGSDPGSCIDNSAYTDNKSDYDSGDSSNNIFIILTIIIIIVLVISGSIYVYKKKYPSSTSGSGSGP